MKSKLEMTLASAVAGAVLFQLCGCATNNAQRAEGSEASHFSANAAPQSAENPQAQALVEAARQCCREARYQDAIKKCDDAIGIQANDVIAFCIKGHALHEMQREQASIEAFNAALRLDRHSVFALAFKASVLQSLGQIQESKALLQEIATIKPREHDAWDCFSRGCALHIGEDYQGALDKYNQALLIEPGNAEVYFNRGMAYKMLKHDAEAVNDFEAALKLYPRYAEVYNELASLLGTEGQFDLAIEDYTKAIQVNLDYAIVYSNRGLAFAAKPNHDYAAAKEDWDMALKLDPSGIAGQSAGNYLARLKEMNK
jgi:tetratricopeptide (TPR) repeat protein